MTIDTVVILQDGGSTLYPLMGAGNFIEGPWATAEEAVAELTEQAGHGYRVVAHTHTSYPDTMLFVTADGS